MLVVKGELVLLIMPSRFIVLFPFMAFLTSSNSFLMFFIIWSLPRVDYAVCFDLLFSRLWASSSLSLWWHRDCDIVGVSRRALRFNSSCCFINSCTLAVSTWIYWAITFRSVGGDEVEVSMSQGTFLVEIQWWLAWENCNLIVPHRQCQTDEVGICLVSMFLLSWWTTCNTCVIKSTQWIKAPVWGLPRTLQFLS